MMKMFLADVRHIKLTKRQTLTKQYIKSSSKASKKDVFLWLLVVLLLIAGIVATYYYQSIAVPLKLSAWIVLLMVGAGIASRTEKGRSIWSFAKKSRAELRKVVWPTRQETIQSTVVVVIIVLLMALVLWVIDSGLVWVADWVTR